MENIINAVVVTTVALGALVALSLLLSIPVWLLWNGCLVGAIDGVREITWLQSWGIMILSGFLFKNTSVSANKN